MDFFSLLASSFFLFPLLAGLSSAIAAGIMGTYAVTRRIIFIAGSISHAALGGIGVALWLKQVHHIEWLSPLKGALAASIFSAFVMGYIQYKYKEREDTVIAVLWSTGMSLGVVFMAITPGYNVELSNFLFGNILWITKQDLLLMISLDILLLVVNFCFFQKFLAICADDHYAKLHTKHPAAIYFLMLSLIAISVVLLIQIVGSILVIAMLAIPPAIACRFVSRLKTVMVFSVILGSLIVFLGMILSYIANWPPGATIALTAACLYTLSFLKKNSF
ncbi:MAG: metal ABC transporter permease [Rhabdochlamydiaceae bacterium]